MKICSFCVIICLQINSKFKGDIMNRFAGLNEKEIDLVKKAGYIIEENKEYIKGFPLISQF